MSEVCVAIRAPSSGRDLKRCFDGSRANICTILILVQWSIEKLYLGTLHRYYSKENTNRVKFNPI